MVVRQRLLITFTLLLLVALVVSACERPLRQDDPTPTPGGPPTNTPTVIESGATSVATVAQGVATEVGEAVGTALSTEPAPTAEGPREETATQVATPAELTPVPTVPAEVVVTPTTGPGAQVSTATPVPTAATGGQPAAPTATPPAAGGGQTSTTPLPATHTVAAGENLYRIGLRYGISWVTLAQFNGLTNANVLQVGQVLRIPGGGPSPTPIASPTPSGEVTYVVKAGDNLFRIGLAVGVNWRLIAEANGIVNPDQIYVGQVLKIPTNAPPGPAPQFTHVVRPGETLFLISLRYGVAWPAIAQANNITSPYVIYVGQSLVIPGG